MFNSTRFFLFFRKEIRLYSREDAEETDYLLKHNWIRDFWEHLAGMLLSCNSRDLVTNNLSNRLSPTQNLHETKDGDLHKVVISNKWKDIFPVWPCCIEVLRIHEYGFEETPSTRRAKDWFMLVMGRLHFFFCCLLLRLRTDILLWIAVCCTSGRIWPKRSRNW